jgi:hypothetical protein
MFVALQIAMFIVVLELTVGSFVTLYALDLRGDSSRGFILFQGGLYLFFALLTLLAMNAFATPELVSNIVLDSAWLRWRLLAAHDPERPALARSTSSPNARKKAIHTDDDGESPRQWMT